jgi:hypothetical protein
MWIQAPMTNWSNCHITMKKFFTPTNLPTHHNRQSILQICIHCAKTTNSHFAWGFAWCHFMEILGNELQHRMPKKHASKCQNMENKCAFM